MFTIYQNKRKGTKMCRVLGVSKVFIHRIWISNKDKSVNPNPNPMYHFWLPHDNFFSCAALYILLFSIEKYGLL